MEKIYRHNIECDSEYFLTHEENNQGRTEKQREYSEMIRNATALIIGNGLIIWGIYWIAENFCK